MTRFISGTSLELKKLPMLSREEEMKLGRRIREEKDLAARNRLCEYFLPYVLSIARKWKRYYPKMELDDLVQWGNVGLIQAADRYDEREFRFSTYACWWIEASIREGVQDSRMIRLPANVHLENGAILNGAKELAAELGRTPTLPEIARKLALPECRITDTLSWMNMSYVSLEQPVGPDGDESRELGHVLPDYSIPLPDVRLRAKDELRLARERVARVCARVANGLYRCDRDRTIFRLYYGLDGTRRHTLDDLTAMMGVSRQRVQQVLNQAWKRLGPAWARPNNNPLLRDLALIAELEELANR